MWPIKFSGFSWLGVTILTILVWSNLKNQTILSAGINKLSPIVVYAEKENTKKDTLPFTQDNWLQKVQQDIASRECHINFAADKKYHQSPNRANNTRITYYPKSIQIAPRTIEEYEAIPPTELKAEKEISKTYEDYTLQLEVKGYGTTKKIIHPFQAEKLISENNEAFAKDDHMQVEYINNEEGTRQNFIIQQPIAGNELAVHLNINTSLTATQENEGSIKFTGKQNSTQLYYNDLKVWDATGKILPAQMKLSNVGQAYALVLAVNTAGAEYPITIDPIVTSGNLTNADWKVETNSASSFMGNSVSSAGDVNGDGYSDVIVAAYGRTSSFTSEGAVYIYHGSATGLSTSANRTILGGAANLWFGSKVATAGDINADGYSDVLIGSDNYTNGQTNEGAVYIYHGSASGIAATPTSIVESNVTSANMGREVSTAGDVNGDGYSDIVIGAESFDNGQTAEGAFWIYQGSASGINTTPMLFVESNQYNWWMGKGVGCAGDINGDGYSDVLIGLYGYTNGQSEEGGTYVYYGSSTGITSATPGAILEGNAVLARMGESVSSAGDVNGDGYSDVVVGLLGYINGQSGEGAAYIYHGSASGINTTLAAKVEPNVANAYMGSDVGCAGDVNGDGYSDIVVGAYTYTNGQSNEGAIYIYKGTSSGISTTPISLIQSNSNFANLGISTSCAGDVNGDGYSDVIAGAYYYSNGQTYEGGASVYHGSASGIITTVAARVEGNQAGAYMGQSVSSAGDVNGDGYNDVIVGALLYTNGQSQEGAAFLYHGSASGISTSPAAVLECNQANAFMGTSVSCAGDVNGDGYSDVIVGAYYYTNGQTNEGVAFVYHGSASGISTSATAMLESNQINAFMGYSVSSAGDVNGDGYSDVIVGAFYYINGQTNEGAAFIYHGGASGISTSVSATLESNQVSAFMGVSVSSAGDVNGDGYSDVIVGAYQYTNGESQEGVAFVYHGSASGISTSAAAMLECNQAGAQMGNSVSSAGDVNGDGYSDVIVGANYYTNGQSTEGAAFVYHGSASGISTTVAAKVESNQANAQMGYSVSSAGDVNGDGYNDVVVGAYGYTNGQAAEGMAFIYHGSASGLSSAPAAMLESNQASAYMGWSVSSAGDVNGDGYSDVIIGAHLYDNNQSNEGAVYIYQGSASGIVSSSPLIIESNQGSARMGSSVTSAGDVNGDGYCDVIAGAEYYANGQANEGAAFLYYGSSTGTTTTGAVMLELNIASSYFGSAVGCAGDVNGDGYSDVIIGAERFTNGQTEEGAFWIYHGSAFGLSTTAAKMVESNQASTHLGIAVNSAGDVNGDGYYDVIAGQYAYANGQSYEGAAFVYHGSSGGINTTPVTTLECNMANAYFGYSVNSSGDVNGDGYSDVVVGAYAYGNGQTNEGAVFVYHGSASGISTTAAMVVESNTASWNMGRSVASAGDVNGDGYNDVVVGVRSYTNVQSSEGAAFIYYGNGGSTGRRNNVRLYNTNLSTPIQQSNKSNSSFGLGLYATSPQGRQKVKMVWEVKTQGQPFSSAGGKITNSVSNTSVQSSFSNTGLTGTNLNNAVNKPGQQTKVRCRVQYDLVTSITGQKYGPWRYPQGYLNGQQGMNSTPLPVEWLSFTAQWLTAGETAQLNWSTASEKNNSHFTILSSIDGQNWEEVAQVNGAGTTNIISNYTFIDNSLKHLNTSTHKHVYYRLMQTDYNGQFSFSEVRELTLEPQSEISVSPNPGSHQVITLKQPALSDLPYIIVDVQGRQVGSGIIPIGRMQCLVDLQHLPAGVYFLSIEQTGKKENTKLIRQ